MLGIVLSILAQAAPVAAPVSAEAALARYRAETAAGPHCAVATLSGDDITVCGRRRADRYRLPLIEPDPGDARHDAVPAERERLLARTTMCGEKSIFLVGCGMAGISVSSRAGVRLGGERPLAP